MNRILLGAMALGFLALGACSNKCGTSSAYGTTSATTSTDASCPNYAYATTGTTNSTAASCYDSSTGQYVQPVNGVCASSTNQYGSGYSNQNSNYGSGTQTGSGGYMTTNGTCYNPYTSQSYYPNNGRC